MTSRARSLFVLLMWSLLLLPTLVFAQNASLKGRFVDPANGGNVGGVAVKLTSFADTADVHRVTAKDDGTFEVTGLGIHSYRLEANRLGYAPLKIVIRVEKAGQDAGLLQLMPMAVNVNGITVTESPAPAVLRQDTTEFRASAVKVNKDATAEDLVQKLPGVTLENGTVKSNGEQVQQVLVNGKPFFGSDPTAAMRNLPADVVDRIQVYDRMSDQAEFSGFDDGQSQKTMNFILRTQKAKFGKVYGGYGDRDRYQAGGNATVIRGATRLTLLGLSNNINQQNFSPQDLFGALSGGGGGGGGGMRMMMFGGGGGFRPRGGGGPIRMGGGGGGAGDPGNFFVNQADGVSKTNSGGLNYVGQWGKKLSVSSSLFANGTDNDNSQTVSRDYVPPQDSLAHYGQSATSNTKNTNIRYDGRFEFTADSSNSVILTPRLYFQNNKANTLGSGANASILGGLLNASDNTSFTKTDGDNLSTRLTLRHRFAKRGRNVSADFNVGQNLKDGNGSQYSLTDYYTGASTVSDTVDQQSTSHVLTNTGGARVAWTEPIVKGWQAQVYYNPSLTHSVSNANALHYDAVSGTYSIPDSSLSNRYTSDNRLQAGGLSVLYTKGTWRLLTTAAYQHSELQSDQTYPFTRSIDKTFEDFLPSVLLTGNPDPRRSIRLQYSTSTTAPSIAQLQNVVDNSNPLALTSGNPELRQTYNQTVSLRLSDTDPMKSKSKFAFMNFTRTAHPIANATFTATSDTTIDGIALARGTQLTAPQNLDASYNANAFAVYSRPTKWLKSILNFNGGGTWTRTPTLINGRVNRSDTYAIRAGTVLASNISQNLDFTVTYFATWNLSHNSLTTSTAGNYFSHVAGLRFNAVVGPKLVIREELNNNLTSGVPGQYGQNTVLWNTTLGKKFLKDDKIELRVTSTDVLGQDRSVNRSITETYVQDARNRTLGRFTQAVLTYNFK